jgi:hypothetical protein
MEEGFNGKDRTSDKTNSETKYVLEEQQGLWTRRFPSLLILRWGRKQREKNERVTLGKPTTQFKTGVQYHEGKVTVVENTSEPTKSEEFFTPQFSKKWKPKQALSCR